MTVTEIFDVPATVITGPADDELRAPRSTGLHISQIYGSLEDEISADSRKRKSNFLESQLNVYRSAGFMWERAFDLALAKSLANDQWIRPEEWHRDGIACSPDLLSLTDWRVGETKFTWKSSRRLDEMKAGTGPLWVWLVQIKSYCYVVGTQSARLFAFFVNGDYRENKPEWRVLDFEFTQLELRENWDMLKAHARRKGWL